MKEISNATLAVLVLVALAVVVTTTTLQLSGGLTGMASTDTGAVSLTINETLAIQVVPDNSSIDFGTCNLVPGESITVDSNLTVGAQDASAGNCTGADTFPSRIQVRNIGNVNAAVTVQVSVATSAFLPSDIGANLDYATYSDGSCTGSMVGSYTAITQSPTTACTNLQNVSGSFWMPLRVIIPPDTQTSQSTTSNTITFTAAIA
ncbi:MAG: hypothetical protein ACMXYD_03270 [Candidatus Woesearchaeota archaeon]